jgi:hypothetical protein
MMQKHNTKCEACLVRFSISPVINAVSPFFSPTIAGAASVVIPCSFFRFGLNFSMTLTTCSYNSAPVIDPLILHSAANYSVILTFISTPLMKIASCAVSATSVLSSTALREGFKLL